MDILVYDHSYSADPQRMGPLQKLAEEFRLPLMKKTTTHREDTSAVEELLQTAAGAYFVHIDAVAWNLLGSRMPSGKYGVRFSTEQLPVTPRTGLQRGLFHCAKRMHENGLSAAEFESLTGMFRDDSADLLKMAQAGSIPSALRNLIRYSEPFQLSRLLMLLEGILATWAAEDERAGTRAARSRDLLCLPAPPPLPPVRFDDIDFLKAAIGKVGDLNRDLADELGLSALTELETEKGQDEGVRQFCKFVAILTGQDQTSLPEDICFGAFKWLERGL